MVKNRIFYILILLTTSTLLYFDNGSVTSLLFYLVIICPILSFAHLVFTRYTIKYEELLKPDTIIKNSDVSYICKLHNNTIIPYTKLRIIFYGDEHVFPELKYVSEYKVLLPMDSFDVKIPLKCRYWGNYKVGIKRIETVDLLGLFKIKYKNKKPVNVKVNPKVVNLNGVHFRPLFDYSNNNVLSRQIKERDFFSDIRLYQYGDTLHDIHWKLSAKQNQLITKNYHSIKNNNTSLFIDLNKHIDYPLNVVVHDKLIEVTIAVINKCLLSLIPVTIIYSYKDLIQQSYEYYEEFKYAYSTISDVEFTCTVSLHELIREKIIYSSTPVGKNIIIITSDMDKSVLSVLYELNQLSYNIYFFFISPQPLSTKNKEDYMKLLNSNYFHPFFINLEDDVDEINEGV